MQFPALASLHTSAPRREEEKDAAVEAAPSAYGEFSLSNPLFQMPVGLIMAIPLLKTEMLILSEETQLVGVFMMFTAAAYVGAGEMVANSLDARKIATMAEHNALEDEAILNVTETIEAHKKRLSLLEDMALVKDTYQAVIADIESGATFEKQHQTRADIVKMLDLVATKNAVLSAAMQASLVEEAAAAVTAKFAADAKAKGATLEAAIAAVGDPSTGAKAGAAVDALFVAFFKGKAAEMKKVAGKPMTLSDADKSAAVEEISAILAREGIKAGDVPSADELLSKVTN